MRQQNSLTFLAFEGLFDVKQRTCSRIFDSVQREETSMSLCQIGLNRDANNSQFFVLKKERRREKKKEKEYHRGEVT